MEYYTSTVTTAGNWCLEFDGRGGAVYAELCSNNAGSGTFNILQETAVNTFVLYANDIGSISTATIATDVNTWYHYKLLKNSTGMYAYRDGSLMLHCASAHAINPAYIILGSCDNSKPCYFDNMYYNDTGIPYTVNLTAQVTVGYDPVTLFTNQTATVIINGTSDMYDEVQWFFDGVMFNDYKLNGTQWQYWNGTAWANCLESIVYAQSHYISTAEDHGISVKVLKDNELLYLAWNNFQVESNATQTIYYLRVVDNTGADLYNFTGTFTQSEDASKTYTFNYSGYGAVLDLNRHYQGSIDADGYLSGIIAFETSYNNSASATYRTVTVTMVGSDTPTDPTHAFLDVKVYDASTNEMIPDVVFTLAYASNGSSKPYYIYGTIKRIEIIKGTAYTWKAASSSYYSMTGTVNMTDSQAMLTIPLNPIPAPTATPAPSSGYYTGGDGQATYTPYTDTQRQNQAMTMIDQLLSAGPSLMQLGILAVFMGLVMMLFPDGKKRRYR